MTPRRQNPDNPLVPIGPFREWLARQVTYYGGVLEVARRVGVHERRVRVLLGTSTDDRSSGSRVHLLVVDRYCVALDQPHMLSLLYPYDETQEAA